MKRCAQLTAVGMATFALLALAVQARADQVKDLRAAVEKGSPLTYEELVLSIFLGATPGNDPNTLVTKSEKTLRQIGTKDLTVLPAGTALTSFEVLRVRGDGRTYLVLLCGAETAATEIPGGGAAILAVFPPGGAEPLDTADVKEDVWCAFGEGFEPLSLGPDDAFTVTNGHSNSNQGYLQTALFHVHGGRLALIDSILTLSVHGAGENSFYEELAFRTEPDPSFAHRKVVATVTLIRGEEYDAAGKMPSAGRPRKVYSQTYRWDKAKDAYVGVGPGFAVLDKFNQDHF